MVRTAPRVLREVNDLTAALKPAYFESGIPGNERSEAGVLNSRASPAGSKTRQWTAVNNAGHFALPACVLGKEDR